ncbi:MAG: hypothetical protein HGB17_03105 [Syntrophobacteraceae bacterium]|nr:hypothetical protein [Syntrophobacteraceae bacterium]
MNTEQKIVIAVLDVVLSVELCIGMFFAQMDPANLTAAFCKSFFSMLIPTLILARIMVKRFRTVIPEPAP